MANDVVAEARSPAPRASALLPAEATGFVGRYMLARRDLPAAHQPPGDGRGPLEVGKTRLTLRAAAEAACGEQDGVRFGPDWAGPTTSVRPYAEAGTGSWPAMSGLGRRPWPPAPQGAAAHPQHACEHLVDACGEFADTVVLRGAPGITLIVTSRAARSTCRASTPSRCCRCPRPRGDRVVRPARGGPSRVQRYGLEPGAHRGARAGSTAHPAIEFAVRLRRCRCRNWASQLESGIRTADGQPPRHQPAAPDAAGRDRLELPAAPARPSGRCGSGCRCSPGRSTCGAAPSTCARTASRRPRQQHRPGACRPRREVRGAAGPSDCSGRRPPRAASSAQPPRRGRRCDARFLDRGPLPVWWP